MKTRAAILSAARSLSAAGDGTFSLRAVARAVGLSPMAIYRHFDDKEALQHALLDAGYDALLVALQRGLLEETPRGRLSAVLVSYARFAETEPGTYRLLFESRYARADADRCTHRRAAATFRLLEDRVRECQAAGALPGDDAERTALDLWALLHGHVTLHRVGRSALPDGDLAAHIEGLLDRWFPAPG